MGLGHAFDDPYIRDSPFSSDEGLQDDFPLDLCFPGEFGISASNRDKRKGVLGDGAWLHCIDSTPPAVPSPDSPG